MITAYDRLDHDYIYYVIHSTITIRGASHLINNEIPWNRMGVYLIHVTKSVHVTLYEVLYVNLIFMFHGIHMNSGEFT